MSKIDDAAYRGVTADSEGSDVQRARGLVSGLGARFGTLAVFLCLIFLLGGSSKPNVLGMVLLRPLAIVTAAYAIVTLSVDDLRRFLVVFALAGATLILTLAHLIPLPASWWSGLPGRELISAITTLAPGGSPWRPLSMVPEATRNALYALAVPLAVLALAAPLDGRAHTRLLVLVMALIGTSGLVGLLQASGVGVRANTAQSEIGGLFANRNHQATALALLLPMLGVVAAFRLRRRPRESWPLFAAASLAGVTLILIVVTGSRTGLLVALVSGLMTPVIMLGTIPRRQRRSSRATFLQRYGMIAFVVAFLAAILLIAIFAGRDQAINRIAQTANDPRYGVWSTVIREIGRFMPWGTGIGTYADAYQTFEPLASLRPTYSNHAHNEWLEIALTAGVPGLALLLAAVVAFVVAAWKSRSATGRAALFQRLGLTVIGLVTLSSITDYPARTPIVAALLALAAIWATSSIRFENDVV
ncbi:O-antigen ligase family protein [Sphingomonas sp. DT-51]|uniref:O-antigen ligase family protein n=1 Tax=Sphingomonas sp. DT-51 TaxID=3396165 RepID=UPI003F19D83A